MNTQRRTRDLRIWLQYWCWYIQFWMSCHKPIYPLWLRGWLLGFYPANRHYVSRRQYRRWLETVKHPENLSRPLPWWIGSAAIGPFIGPWQWLAKQVRKGTGGRSHRCEFTDPAKGALYGHHEGAFMDRLFEVFIARISGDDEQP